MSISPSARFFFVSLPETQSYEGDWLCLASVLEELRWQDQSKGRPNQGHTFCGYLFLGSQIQFGPSQTT